jgi:hypothetical protein
MNTSISTLSHPLAPISAFFILYRFRVSDSRGRPAQVLNTSQPTAMTDSVKDGTDEERDKNRKRFELELEFVQALANPFYLHSLAQQGILYQPAFINYLKYLLYWKEKDYARFILWVLSYFSPPF